MPLSTSSPAGCARSVRGLTPDPHDHEVALDGPAVAKAHTFDRAVALEGLASRAGEELDAVVAVNVAVHGSDL